MPSGVTGLTLKPSTASGRGKWNLRYVSPVTGKRRDMGMGVYPDVSVADALRLGQEARELIAGGDDPVMVRRAQSAVPTFEQAARRRWENIRDSFRNAKHRMDWIASLERHAFPTLGDVRVDKITPRQIADTLRPIWLKTPETASRVKQRCHNVMAACWAEGYIQANPVDVVGHLLSDQPTRNNHQPAMPWKLVPAFVQEHLRWEPVLGSRAALLFLILTAARSGEVRGMTWAEVDVEARLWTVPAERMKAHREHRVPLSDAAMALLGAQGDDELVFPSLRGKMLSDMALTSLLRKTGATSDVPGRTATAHGFRSSFRDWAADHGYQSDLAERALAHTIGNKVRAAYERTDQLEARVAMMEQWAAHVMGRAGANVVPFKREAKSQESIT